MRELSILHFNRSSWVFRSSVLTLILFISFGLMLSSAYQDSPTSSETAHISNSFAYLHGIPHAETGTPLLARAFGSIPFVFLDVNSGSAQNFLFNPENNTASILLFSRIISIILTILTALLLYFWSRQLIGEWWALLPVTFFCFSPAILAYGHLATSDMIATLGTLLSLFTFTQYLLSPRPRHLWGAGIGIGIALLSSFSNLILLPLFSFLFFVFKLRNTHLEESRFRFIYRSLFPLLAIFVIGLAVLYGMYLTTPSPDTSLAAPFKTYLLDAYTPAAPENISLGGEFFSAQPWFYLPVLFLFKGTLSFLLLLLAGSFFSIWNVIRDGTPGIRWKRFSDYLGTHLPEFCIFLFLLIYWILGIVFPSAREFTYLIPLFPLMSLLAVGGIKIWFVSHPGVWGFGGERRPTPERQILPLSLERSMSRPPKTKIAVLSILILWHLVSTFSAYPFLLSYSNLLAGGTEKAYQIIPSQEYDKGQDLGRLARWIRAENENLPVVDRIHALALLYSGGGDPAYYLSDTFVPWNFEKGDPREKNIEWFAVSLRELSAHYAFLKESGPSSWFSDVQKNSETIPSPYARIGTSIFVYHL